MVLKVSEVCGSLDRYHGDIEGTEGLLRASASFGESLVGGMAFRSMRSAVCSESASTSHGSTLSVSSMMSTSPSKPSVTSGGSACSKPIPIVLQKKHSSYTDKGQLHTLVDAMRAQSPPRSHPHEQDPEAAVYKNWLVSTFAPCFRRNCLFHVGAPILIDKSSACSIAYHINAVFCYLHYVAICACILVVKLMAA